jgi:hypothetical protein
MQQLFFASVFLRDCMRRGAKLLNCCIAIANLPCIYNRRKIGKCWRKSSKGLKQSNASIHNPSNLANRYYSSTKLLHQLCIDSLWKFGKDTLNVQFTHPYHKNTRLHQELEQMRYSRKGTPTEIKQIADLCHYHGKVLRLSGIEVERLKMVRIAPFACMLICMGT